jgi:GT2 family glycosyltransferase
MKQIAVLITCHNRKEKTLACLSSLYTCIVPIGYSFEVFLVDDGSTDGSSETVSKQFPLINIVHGDGTLFWNRGMNRAWVEAAKKYVDYYFWLNDDTILYSNALTVLLASSVETNDQKILVGSTCAEDNKELITYGGRSKKVGLVKPTDKLQHCEYFNGNVVLIPRFVFQKVGMNDPLFHHALGDFDYGLRASKCGVSSVVVPGVLGECDEHKDLEAWCNPITTLRKRFKLLYTPLGNHPIEFFKFDKRHNGIMPACFHFITIHLRVFFPWIWVKYK